MVEDIKEKLHKLRLKLDEAQKLADIGQFDKAVDITDLALLASGFISGQFVVEKPDLTKTQAAKVPEGSRVIEGVFDGQYMVGDDGKQYLVPPNYSSKSKLVEGDMMKLAITPEGAFVYKQIGPIERRRVTCKLQANIDGMWEAVEGKDSWKLLTAAVTYFKGKEGDEVIILVPSGTPSKWAAVENIILK